MLKFLNESKMEFSKLPHELMGLLVTQRANGHGIVQFWSNTLRNWVDMESFSFCLDGIYRTKPIPMPELIVPWDLIHSRWKYVGVSMQGIWFSEKKLHPKPHIKDAGYFFTPDGPYISNDILDFNIPEGKTPFDHFGLVVIKRPDNACDKG